MSLEKLRRRKAELLMELQSAESRITAIRMEIGKVDIMISDHHDYVPQVRVSAEQAEIKAKVAKLSKINLDLDGLDL